MLQLPEIGLERIDHVVNCVLPELSAVRRTLQLMGANIGQSGFTGSTLEFSMAFHENRLKDVSPAELITITRAWATEVIGVDTGSVSATLRLDRRRLALRRPFITKYYSLNVFYSRED